MRENWIIPCSVKFYNVVEHLRANKTIVWRRVSAIQKEDIAYLYVGVPYGQIKFKCHVINDNVDEATVEENAYAIKENSGFRKNRYIKLELDYEYPDGELPLEQLRLHGLGQTRIQARTDRKIQSFINEVNSKLNVD